MESNPTNEWTEERYDGNETTGTDTPAIPTIPETGQQDKQPARIQRIRREIEFTNEVRYVSGPEAESIARNQYEAIKEVLQWLQNNHHAA